MKRRRKGSAVAARKLLARCPECGKWMDPAKLPAHQRMHDRTRAKAAPSQTADEAFAAQETRRARAASKLLGDEAKAALLKDERNPLLRDAQGIGDVLRAAERVKATAVERQRQRVQAAKRARVGVKDAGRTVVFDTEGRRYASLLKVPKGRKVFVVRPDRRGRLRYMNTVDPKTIMHGVAAQVMPQAPNRFDFRRWAKLAPREYGAVAAELAGRYPQPVWSGQNVVYTTKVEQQDMDGAARKVANIFDQAARSQAEITQWVADVLVEVKGERPVSLTTPVLNAGQFYEFKEGAKRELKAKRGGRGAAQSIVTYKLRDLLRAELGRRGLVSRGSARRVGRHSWNRGKPRSKWTLDPEGAKPWKGANKQDAPLGSFQFRLRKVF